MKEKVVLQIMLILLLFGMLTWAFNIQPVGATAFWREVTRWSGSAFPNSAEFNMEFEISHVDWRVRWSYSVVGSFEFESLLLINKNGELFIYESSYLDRSGVRNVHNETGTFTLSTICLNMYEYTIIVEQDVDSAYARTAYIRADGSIDPLTMPISTVDNVTYTFIDNIYDWTVVVERDNIIIDGNGYALQGTKDRSIHWIDGVDLSGRTNVTVRNIQIKNFSNGIILSECSNNIISGNNITDSGQGIHLWRSLRVRISGNNITNNYNGMIANNCSDSSMSGNNITKGTCGIWFMGSSNNSVEGNTIENNDVGISLAGSFSNNIIYHNNFINNSHQFVPSDYANVLDYGFPSGGNYWSDYNGTDANHDGIGDTPYVIDAKNTDHYPLMVQYVIPEFPSFLIPLLLMIATLLGVIAYRRKTSSVTRT
jgi:parallel beta-helix repeat protein